MRVKMVVEGIIGFNKDSLTSSGRFRGINGVVDTSRSELCIIPDTPNGHFSGSAGIASVLVGTCRVAIRNNSLNRRLGGVGTQCSRVVSKLKLRLALSSRFTAVGRGLRGSPCLSCTSSHKRCLGKGILTGCLNFRFVSPCRAVFFGRRKRLGSCGAGGILGGHLRRTRRTIVPNFCKRKGSKHIGAFSHNKSSIANSVTTTTTKISICRG